MFDFKTVLAVVIVCVCSVSHLCWVQTFTHKHTHTPTQTPPHTTHTPTHTHTPHTHTHTESDRVKRDLLSALVSRTQAVSSRRWDGGERYTDAWHRHDVTTHPRSVPAHNAPATLSQPAENTE